MDMNDEQITWMQRTRSLGGGASLGGPQQLQYVLPPSEMAGCTKYLDAHKFAVVLPKGKAGLTPADYEIRLDDNPLGLYGVVGVLLQQIPEGALPDGPIKSAAREQVTSLVEDRYQSALNKAMADHKASPAPTPVTDPQPDPTGKSTTIAITAPPATKHADEEAEKLYEIDLDAVRTLSATKSGNVPPDPQFTLKFTKHVEVWGTKSSGDKPTWTFKVLGDPLVSLQSGTNFKLNDQFSVDILHLTWDSHLLPATELALQANGSIFLDKQIGAQFELEQPLMSEVSFILDGTFDYGKGPDTGKTNYAITAGLEFKILGFGKKK